MKKVLLTLALISATCIGAFAQISVGAGYVSETQKNAYTSGNKTTTEPTSYNGFYLGADYTLDLGDGLGVVAGLKGVYYGHKDESTVLGVTATAKSHEFNLVVPVDVNYSYTLTPDFKVFAFAGPSFSFGLTSKTKTSYSNSDNTDTINHYGDNSDYKKFNLFLGAGVGVDFFDTIRVKLGYDIGLLNRSSADNTKINDAQFYVGVAYLF